MARKASAGALFHTDVIFVPNPLYPEEALRDKATKLYVEKLLKKVVAKAKDIAPYDTGNLRDSIGYEMDRRIAEGQVFADVPYAAFVEFGTDWPTPAQPYLRPAMDSVVPRG